MSDSSDLYEAIETLFSIECSECGDTHEAYASTTLMGAANEFWKNGWRLNAHGGVVCKECRVDLVTPPEPPEGVK